MVVQHSHAHDNITRSEARAYQEELVFTEENAVDHESRLHSSRRPFFRCKCRVGFRGSRCESNINECSSSPCLNNSTCVDLVDGFVCKCPSNFQGVYCERPYDFCQQSTNLCALGATCVSLASGGFKCLCAPNQTGLLCNLPLDLCAALMPCRNGGSCVSAGYDYKYVLLYFNTLTPKASILNLI